MNDLLKHFLETFLTAEGIASLVITIAGLVGGIAWLSGNRKRNVALAIDIAFHAAEDAAEMTEGPDALDKVSYALGKLNEYMVANKWREPTASEVARAKIVFEAKNGAQHAVAKVQADALVRANNTARSTALTPSLGNEMGSDK